MPYKAKQILKALKALGFKEIRQRGSYIILRHTDGRKTIVPHHPGTFGAGLFNEILKQADITRDAFRKHL